MAKARGMAPEQLRTLDQLKKLPGIDRFYLAGASAIAWHLRHRRSLDLDLFSKSEKVSLDSLRLATRRARGIKVVDATDTVLALKIGPELWERIKVWFRREAPALLESPKVTRHRARTNTRR